MVNNGVSFTAYLEDKFSSVFDKITGKTDVAYTKIKKNLAGVKSSGHMAAMSISEIDKKLDQLKKTRSITIDTRSIKNANTEIKKLLHEKAKLESGAGSTGSGGGGGGGIGSALMGGIASAVTIGTLTAIGNKAIETTSKYQKFEAVLTNTLGTKGEAQQQMEMLQKFAAETPFQVDQLTAAYVKLVNQGFKPTKGELTSLGDLASSTGKDFDQLAEAVLDAQTGEFERLKEFGIKANKSKGGGIDFMFKGTSSHVDGSAASIQKYIIGLGQAKGVTGSMAAISATTGGQISNLSDNVDDLWKTIGERLTPTVNGSVGMLSKMVGTIKGWIAVPIEQKINDEIVKIRVLQTELTSSNTTEERRKGILKELEQINPNITAGIDAEAISYGKLASNIDAVTNALTKKITLASIEKRYSKTLGDFTDAQSVKAQSMAAINQAIYSASPELAKRTDLTQGQKQSMARKILEEKGAKDFVKKGFYGEESSVFDNYLQITQFDRGKNKGKDNPSSALQVLNYGVWLANKKTAQLGVLTPAMQRMQDEQNTLGGEISKVLDVKPGAGTTGLGAIGAGGKGTKAKSLDSAGLHGVSGGSSVKNIVININKLVESFTLNTNVEKMMPQQAKDVVIEGLLTAVNDANLAAD